MNKITIFICILACTIFIQACSEDDDCLYGDGNLETDDIFVPAFDGVHLNGSGNVYITQGNSFRVTVETDRNLIDEIETDVHNGIWDIEFNRCVHELTVLNVYITMPHVYDLVISGSGFMRSENVIYEEEIYLEINGSGEMDIAFEGEQLYTDISGSGDILLEGNVHTLSHKVSGWADLRAFNLVADDVYIDISGSGRSEVTALDLLDVSISGSGDVYYKGNPVINTNISGTGNIIRG